MKQLLLILSIGLLTVGSGMSQNRYSTDEIGIQEDFESGERTAYLKRDMEPIVNGVVYCEFGDMGRYVDGKMDGLWRGWYKNGQLQFEINFKEWKWHGSVRRWHENGQLKEEGNYKDGDHVDGSWRQWDRNGQLQWETNYKDGKKEGLYRAWYEDGQLNYEYNYKDGKQHGLCRMWYENSKTKFEEVYEMGVLKSEKKWDEDGNLTKDETY